MNSASGGGYGTVAKTLHWLVFVLVAAQFVVATAMPDIGRGTKPDTLIKRVADRQGHDRRYSIDMSKVESMGFRCATMSQSRPGRVLQRETLLREVVERNQGRLR